MKKTQNNSVAFATAMTTCLIVVFSFLASGCMDGEPLGGNCTTCQTPDAAPVNPGVCKGKTTSTVCREAAGSCDVPEFCTGTSDDCPADSVEPAGTLCLGTNNVEGTCNGTSTQCTIGTGQCADNTRNGDESDVDCGGSCPDCAVGRICDDNHDCASNRCVAGRCVASFVTVEVSSPQASEAHIYGAQDQSTDNTIDHAGSTTYIIGLSQTEACTAGVEVAVRVARSINQAMPWYSCDTGAPSLSTVTVKINGTVKTGTLIKHPWVCNGGGEGNLAFSQAQLGCP